MTKIIGDLGPWLEGLNESDFNMEEKRDIGRCIALDRRVKLGKLLVELGIREKVKCVF